MGTHVWHMEVKDKVMLEQRSKGWIATGQEKGKRRKGNVPEKSERAHKGLEVRAGMADLQ